MWIDNARLVLPGEVIERGALRVEGGLIAEVRRAGVAGPALDARGMTLLPGLVDLHGDMIERELEPRPGTRFDPALALIELDKRLAASGVTTAFASLSFADGLGLRSESRALEIIAAILEHRAHLHVDHRVHARYEVSNVGSQPQLLALLRAGTVDLLSLMDHTPGQGQYRDLETYVQYMARWLGKERAEVRALALARPDSERVWALGAALGRAAQDAGVPVASHDDDTPEKVALVREMGATISEFPVTLAAAQAACARGMTVFMGAPNALRGQSHSGNLSALDALAAGALHGLAADYAPMTMLQAAWQAALRGLLSWPAAADLVTGAPARATGLTDRGALAVGRRADLVLVEDHLRPRVRLTAVRGRVVYHDGALDPAGQRLLHRPQEV